MKEVKVVTTIIPSEFSKIAEKIGYTAEFLLSALASTFVTNPPKQIVIESAAPLNSQECATCVLRERCDSRQRRDGYVCLSRLT
jgi:hypothetical protein